MDIKDILLFLQQGAPCAAQTDLAMRLASEYGAEVTGLCLFSEPAPRPADTYAIGSAAIADVLADRDQAVRELIEPIETAFRQAAAAHDCRVGWGISGPDEPMQLSALRARFGDDEFIQLTGAIGYYSMLAMTVNACELEAAPGAEVLKV